MAIDCLGVLKDGRKLYETMDMEGKLVLAASYDPVTDYNDVTWQRLENNPVVRDWLFEYVVE